MFVLESPKLAFSGQDLARMMTVSYSSFKGAHSVKSSHAPASLSFTIISAFEPLQRARQPGPHGRSDSRERASCISRRGDAILRCCLRMNMAYTYGRIGIRFVFLYSHTYCVDTRYLSSTHLTLLYAYCVLRAYCVRTAYINHVLTLTYTVRHDLGMLRTSARKCAPMLQFGRSAFSTAVLSRVST